MFHPFLNATIRSTVRMGLRDEGVGPLKAIAAVWALGDDDIKTYSAAVAIPASLPAGAIVLDPEKSGAIFDGSLIKALIEWLKSDDGKAFLAQLAKIIVAALMAALGL